MGAMLYRWRHRAHFASPIGGTVSVTLKNYFFSWLLVYNILGKSKVISGYVPICVNACTHGKFTELPH